MSDEPPTIGTRYIASVEPYEAIVELREDGWYRGIFNDDRRGWEIAPGPVETARRGREYCENHLAGLDGRLMKLHWRQVRIAPRQVQKLTDVGARRPRSESVSAPGSDPQSPGFRN